MELEEARQLVTSMCRKPEEYATVGEETWARLAEAEKPVSESEMHDGVRMEVTISPADWDTRLRAIFASAATPARRGSLWGYPVRVPLGGLRARFRLLLVRGQFADRDDYAGFREGYLRLHRIRMQIAFYQSLKNLLRAWRLFHACLASFLVVTIAAHIAVSLYLGYGWRR